MYDVIKDRKAGLKKERDDVTLFGCKIGQIQLKKYVFVIQL